TELAPVVDELGIGVIARLPLASGFLSGDFRTKEDLPSSPLFDAALDHVGKVGTRVLHAIDEVATQLGETNGRVAMSWALTKPSVVATAVRVKSAEQLVELGSAGEIELTRQQFTALDKASMR